MKKDLLIITTIILIITMLCTCTNIQSVDEYYLSHLDEITEDSETVFLTIDCSTILDNWDKLDKKLQSEKYIPKDGKILPKTEFVLREGDTVFDILDRVIRHNRIHMEAIYSNSYGSNYIQGINQIYEKSCGPLSGWMFMVNGEYPNYGCSKYILKDGDDIQWLYTCDLGADIGGNWEDQYEGV